MSPVIKSSTHNHQISVKLFKLTSEKLVQKVEKHIKRCKSFGILAFSHLSLTAMFFFSFCYFKHANSMCIQRVIKLTAKMWSLVLSAQAGGRPENEQWAAQE